MKRDRNDSPRVPTSLRRRGFLLAAIGAGGAGAAALALKPAAQAVESVAERTATTERGYKLSAHVRRYYQTAKV
jgi:hypothetical protein